MLNDGSRVAVLTGAGSGITKETARLLSREMHVAIWDVDESQAEAAAGEIRAEGGEAVAWEVDVCDSNSVRAAAGEVIQRFGRVDALVTGAGIAQFVDFLDLTEDQWDRMIDVHMKGTFNSVQALLPQMKGQGYGRITCISSTAGMNGVARHVHYCAAKAGIIGFTKALCREIGPWGVTINVVAPGAIESPFWDNLPPDVLTRLRRGEAPVGRLGQPSDVARCVEFLTSSDSDFITGWVLSVNGGVYV